MTARQIYNVRASKSRETCNFIPAVHCSIILSSEFGKFDMEVLQF
jgi:hypothetical protein